ncbi:hypothetical protein NVP1174O_41 [Vibrio phage 1.174.O._10N.261.55.A8]|nr:hypothetical protein NVP1174O_41 [Vibrio phage 1.174.O._10N.261.55.A8]
MMSDINNINKALGEPAKFYQHYLERTVASDFRFHLNNGIGRIADELQAKTDFLALTVKENAELREMLKRDRAAFLNQIELDLIKCSAKQETRELADSIHKLLNKND